jgi:hypothetical protein
MHLTNELIKNLTFMMMELLTSKIHQRISNMVCFLSSKQNVVFQWHAYIYFEVVPFMNFMNLPCYSSNTFYDAPPISLMDSIVNPKVKTTEGEGD